MGECGREELLGRLADVLRLFVVGAADWLVRLLLTMVGVGASSGSAGDEVLDFLFLRRDELGSAEAARA
jgi:hypothetical protein